MPRKVLIVVMAIGLVAAGCGKSKSGSNSSAAKTVTVNVDAKSDAAANGFNSAFTAFFPSAVTLHPGDTANFVENWTGEPHTVTFGTLIDAGLAAADKLPPNAPTQPPELLKVPDVFPTAQGDAVQTTGQPCFVASGDLPTGGAACPKVTPQPDFTGTQSLYSSGFLPEGKSFAVKLADDIAPGTYRFMCVIHRAAMQGKITVVAKGDKTAQTAAQVSAAGASALAADVAKLKTAFAPFATLTAATAAAGGASPDVPAGIITEFGPKSISVPVGGTVTWDVQGPHTVAFNAPESAVGAFAPIGADGVVHLNVPSLIPSGGPGLGPADPPPTAPKVVDGGKYSGSGFRSSGTLLGFGPPGILKFKLTFTTAGTYPYRCTFHPDMQGTVKVG